MPDGKKPFLLKGRFILYKLSLSNKFLHGSKSANAGNAHNSPKMRLNIFFIFPVLSFLLTPATAGAVPLPTLSLGAESVRWICFGTKSQVLFKHNLFYVVEGLRVGFAILCIAKPSGVPRRHNAVVSRELDFGAHIPNKTTRYVFFYFCVCKIKKHRHQQEDCGRVLEKSVVQ